eukprot:scaffold15602_cov99-Isochrysis_galbana.AAC.1
MPRPCALLSTPTAGAGGPSCMFAKRMPGSGGSDGAPFDSAEESWPPEPPPPSAESESFSDSSESSSAAWIASAASRVGASDARGAAAGGPFVCRPLCADGEWWLLPSLSLSSTPRGALATPASACVGCASVSHPHCARSACRDASLLASWLRRSSACAGSAAGSAARRASSCSCSSRSRRRSRWRCWAFRRDSMLDRRRSPSNWAERAVSA